MAAGAFWEYLMRRSDELLDHTIWGKTPLALCAAPAAVDFAEAVDSLYHFVGGAAQIACHPVTNQLGHGATREGDHRGAAGERLKHDVRARIVPPNRSEKRNCLAEER